MAIQVNRQAAQAAALEAGPRTVVMQAGWYEGVVESHESGRTQPKKGRSGGPKMVVNLTVWAQPGRQGPARSIKAHVCYGEGHDEWALKRGNELFGGFGEACGAWSDAGFEPDALPGKPVAVKLSCKDGFMDGRPIQKNFVDAIAAVSKHIPWGPGPVERVSATAEAPATQAAGYAPQGGSYGAQGGPGASPAGMAGNPVYAPQNAPQAPSHGAGGADTYYQDAPPPDEGDYGDTDVDY